MNNVFLLPPTRASAGAAALSSSLGIKRIRHEGSKFVGGPNKTVINWGCSSLPPEVEKCNVLNPPYAVDICTDKVSFFNHVSDHCRVPQWTTNHSEALSWVGENKIVFARTLTKSSGGKGIVEVTTPEELSKAPLYTLYVPKKMEYRVHMFRGKEFLIQRKGLSPDMNASEANWRVRNLANGFIFVRNDDGPVPIDVITQAKLAFDSIVGLDFGSVDVIYNVKRKEAYVLEINTASGLVGSTVDDYSNVFKENL